MDKVNTAKSIENPFQDIAASMDTLNSNDFNFKIIFKKIKDIAKELFDEILKLTEVNVDNYFTTNSLGWSTRKKRKELKSKTACFLIAKDKDLLAGFAMFKFDLDYNRPVLYCYELQIKEEYQGSRLGTHLMKCMEELAKLHDMDLIVLTALTNNEKAMRFYENCGFILDETDPNHKDYKILSKAISK